MRTPSSERRERKNIEMQRFMRGKDTRKERKLETKQAEYSKGSHTPRIIMKFPRLPLASVGPLTNLCSDSPFHCKQVGARASQTLPHLTSARPLALGEGWAFQRLPSGIQMEKQALGPAVCTGPQSGTVAALGRADSATWTAPRSIPARPRLEAGFPAFALLGHWEEVIVLFSDRTVFGGMEAEA